MKLTDMRYCIYIYILLLILRPSFGFSEEPTIIGKDGAQMVLIPGGDFQMGSKDEDLIEIAPLHKVYVDSFYMDRYEVTNGKFAAFLNSIKPSEGIDGDRWKWVVLRSDLDTAERATFWPTEILYSPATNTYSAFENFEDHPVITVSWYAAEAYCNWAGERLPTEAEWERAARGGLVKKQFPWGNEIPIGGVIFGRKWFSNSVPAPTEKVGNYFYNGYGLYDMSGNVWEWCSDWYAPDYYDKSPYKNPPGATDGADKVFRGGSWYNTFHALRIAFRNFGSPDNLDDAVGFRCVKSPRKIRTLKK